MVCVASSTRRNRQSKAEIEKICEAAYALLCEENPMTVRQVFYRLVSLGVIEKTEAKYQRTVVRLLSRMRRERRLPFSWIADSTRWMHKRASYDSTEEALRITAEAYRRQLWADQPVYVEIWVEKESLAGVIFDETDPYDVPLMVAHGYSSLTFLQSTAENLASLSKPAVIYHLGDWDPSGVDIARKIEHDLREFAPDAEIRFTRAAVTAEQIQRLNLPTRPTKKTDSRACGWIGDSVDLDAIPPAELRAMVRGLIEQNIDGYALTLTRIVEREERDLLLEVASRTGRAVKFSPGDSRCVGTFRAFPVGRALARNSSSDRRLQWVVHQRKS